VRAPGSHSPSGPSPPTSVAFVYAVLTCENIPPDQHRIHVRADGADHHSIRSWVRPIHWSRTYGGQDLGKASGSANRLLSRTVTVFAATRPGRRTPRPRPQRHLHACQPGHRPSTLMVANRPPRCPPRHPVCHASRGVQRSSGTAGNMTSKDRRPRRLAPGGPWSPKTHSRRLVGDDQRVPAGQRGHAGEPHAQRL